MKTKEIHFKEVSFPHLRATVKFFDLSKLQGVPIKGAGYTTLMTQDENGCLEVGVFLEEIERNIKKLHCTPYVYHEITHAVQYICQERGIEMQNEMESVAYMVHYLGEQLLETAPKEKETPPSEEHP